MRPAPLPSGLRVVALGGGTGMPVVLAGMKTRLFPPSEPVPAELERLTAIVTAADDGGSSGRLRRDFSVLPPGDVRNCLLALAAGDPALAEIFRYRFDGGGELGQHSLGNLILTALARLEDDFPSAARSAGRL
ncbi:MAG TPA: gluconeogenesis factor YvcK family protein, partial [Candidatus Polarisedimenticolaceae bacterium]|nr:gluconeogenesis factor YvcK family protein [Candidatus Polarisedimenticolaceae bacterium]